ncbi:MAG TPA: HAMP domain-containing sensor histidine kinase [Steroidobacteraceae bacterium]|jgi:signal transduction histidine kinase|nr:HAMP domain-containing sensor histidine kinase [Steroidobacteraceae bacterium]
MNGDGLSGLADYLQTRRGDILLAWRNVIKKDPALTSSDPLPRADIYDHIPALLSSFEQRLRLGSTATPSGGSVGHAAAAAHGLQRWQQGYDLREVTRELGKLNEIVVGELESFPAANTAELREARRLWAALCGTGIEESVGQYFKLQQQEALGHVKDLEGALAETKQIEQQRADLWRQAAHDLRGNLGVVANVTVGLTKGDLREPVRDSFVRILMRNVTSLHHLLNDVTDLARLQAGREERRIEAIDVSPILLQLCEGIRPLAQQQQLYLRVEGPPGFSTDGDEVKIRRIAQNLLLNALKFTAAGGITVSWGDSTLNDPKRWELCIKDTGPGIHSGSDKPLTLALEKAHEQSGGSDPAAGQDHGATPKGNSASGRSADDISSLHLASGEGLGLSIVKRLCDLLDATIEMSSELGVGTTFRILFPRQYSS